MTPPKSALIELAVEKAIAFKIDPAIFCGLVEQESSWRPRATRFEPGYRWFYGVNISKEEKRDQATSWGLCQVMGAVLREYGWRGLLPSILDEPGAQLEYGALHLRRLYKRWGGELEFNGLEAYNGGRPSSHILAHLPKDEKKREAAIANAERIRRYAENVRSRSLMYSQFAVGG